MSHVTVIDLEPLAVMHLRSLFGELVRGLLLVFVIVPLRLVAGRRPLLHRPYGWRYDADRVSALELELDLREPNLIEQFTDPDLTCTPNRKPRPRPRPAAPKPPSISFRNVEQQIGHDIATGLAQGLATTNEARELYREAEQAWRDKYAHAGHDHEMIDVTSIGDGDRQYIRGRCLTPASDTVEALRDRRNQAWDYAKGLLDFATEHQGGIFNADQQHTWDELNRALHSLDQRIAAIHRAQDLRGL